MCQYGTPELIFFLGEMREGVIIKIIIVPQSNYNNYSTIIQQSYYIQPYYKHTIIVPQLYNNQTTTVQPTLQPLYDVEC